jgi:hypothetical protein
LHAQKIHQLFSDFLQKEMDVKPSFLIEDIHLDRDLATNHMLVMHTPNVRNALIKILDEVDQIHDELDALIQTTNKN